MATEESINDFKEYIESKGMKFFAVSAATTQGTKELVLEIAKELEKLPPIKKFEVQPLTQEEIEARLISNNSFEITVEDGVYVVHADWLWNILKNVNMDDYESLQYFQRVLNKTGIIDKLEEMGIEEGDTVSILDFEFDYLK